MPVKSNTVDPSAHLSEEAIRQRAYMIWEADGRQHGRDDHYWGLAQAEAAQQLAAATATKVAKATKAKPANDAPAAVKKTKAVKATVKAGTAKKPAKTPA